MDALFPNFLTALKVVVFGYILASPMIKHDSTCALNTSMFHMMAVVVSAAVLVVDVTLGLLMLMASAIMIGSFNYDHAQRAAAAAATKPVQVDDKVLKPVPATPPPKPKQEPGHEQNNDKPPPPNMNDIIPGLMEPAPVARASTSHGCDAYSLGAKETYHPLDFLYSPGLNPNGFVTADSLRNVQSNLVSSESLDNVYSPLGDAVYTAQGILPGSDLKGAA